jgi:hypothetical protein
MSGSVASFMAEAPAAMQGNTPWAAGYAQTIRRVVTSAAFYSPRSLQTQLGPSELGVHCDRQIVSKLAGLPRTNHVVDPWPSIVGTAVHAWLANAIAEDNVRTGQLRWIPEQRVHPHPDHPGTADAYDTFERALIDWKVLGQTTLARLRQINKPARRYIVQLLLYYKGYLALGLPVRRIVLVAFPRTGSSLSGMYVWEHIPTPEDDLLINETFRRVAIHKQLASEIQQGRMTIDQIPRQPDDEECYFCPFYRPQSARDHGPGCPGTVQLQYD